MDVKQHKSLKLETNFNNIKIMSPLPFSAIVTCIFMVELTRIELVSENKSTKVSPSAGCEKHSLSQNLTAKAMTLVVSYAWQRSRHPLLTFTTI